MVRVLLLILFGLPNFAAALDIGVHDITQRSANTYELGKPDPYLTFAFEQEIDTKDQGVLLEVEILSSQEALDSDKKIPAMLFWSNQLHGFNTNQRINFDLDPAAGVNQFYIPGFMLDDKVGGIRIDIDRCACLVKVNEPKWRVDSREMQALYPEAAKQYESAFIGKQITLDEWNGRQFKATDEEGVYVFSDWDPRIVTTTPLNVPLNVAGGIYLDFDYSLENKYQKYELFYNIAGRGWNQLRSAHFVLPKPEAGTSNQIFLPFNRINSDLLLTALRLDFEACETCKLTLKQTRLVGADEVEEYSRFTPERLYYVHTKTPPMSVIKKEIVHKLGKDVPFFVFYSLLLLTTIISVLWVIIRV